MGYPIMSGHMGSRLGSHSGSKSRAELKRMTTDQLLSYTHDPRLREDVIAIISKRTLTEENLGQKIWNSPLMMFYLLQELCLIYWIYDSKTFNMGHAVRVCNAIALIQCVASDPELRMPFLGAKIPLYLYPFLMTKSTGKPAEYIRLMSLGVIGTLIKVEDETSPDIVTFLLDSEVFPLCMRCMDVGAEMSKAVSTFILAKILMYEEGLLYCCSYPGRFFAVTSLLAKMVDNIGESSGPKLLRNIIRCYLRLSLVTRTCEQLSECFPEKLRGSELTRFIKDDPITLKFLEEVLENIANVEDKKPKAENDVKIDGN